MRSGRIVAFSAIYVWLLYNDWILHNHTCLEMTNQEIIIEQQRQIDELFEIIEEFKLLINWQKLEIAMLEEKQFVRNEN